MPPKKAPKNAFYFYMMEVKPEFDRQGRTGGMPELVNYAHPRWKVLPEQEKRRFEEKAQEFKRQKSKMPNKDKIDVSGMKVCDRQDPQKETERHQKIVESFVNSLPTGEGLLDYIFYAVDFQCLGQGSDGVHPPVEMAVIAFSLKKGIDNVMHAFVKPPPPQPGDRYLHQRKSDDTHKIPVQGHSSVAKDGNFGGIWIQLDNFAKASDASKGRAPYLFCKESDIIAAEQGLDYIHANKLFQAPNKFKMLPFERFIRELVRISGKYGGNTISMSSATDILESTAYDFETSLRCSFHKKEDIRYCSQAVLKGYCYSLFDQLRVVYDLELTPRHLPPTSTSHEGTIVVTQPPPNSAFAGAGRGTQVRQNRGESHGPGMGEPYPSSDASSMVGVKGPGSTSQPPNYPTGGRGVIWGQPRAPGAAAPQPGFAAPPAGVSVDNQSAQAPGNPWNSRGFGRGTPKTAGMVAQGTGAQGRHVNPPPGIHYPHQPNTAGGAESAYPGAYPGDGFVPRNFKDSFDFESLTLQDRVDMSTPFNRATRPADHPAVAGGGRSRWVPSQGNQW